MASFQASHFWLLISKSLCVPHGTKQHRQQRRFARPLTGWKSKAPWGIGGLDIANKPSWSIQNWKGWLGKDIFTISEAWGTMHHLVDYLNYLVWLTHKYCPSSCTVENVDLPSQSEKMSLEPPNLTSPLHKSARTVGAKGRAFPEALTQSALAGGGGRPFFAGKMHGTFIKHRNLQHFEAPETVCGSFWCYNFAARIVTDKMWNLGAV